LSGRNTTGHGSPILQEKLEVAHHVGKTCGVNVAAAFQRLLTLLTTFRGLKAIQKLFEFGDIEIITFGAYLACG
jgi:hypothetical protein